jgi:lysophospholipase L1-like esterase
MLHEAVCCERHERRNFGPIRSFASGLVCLAFLCLSVTLSGCLFFVDNLVPHHANVGDRLALRSLQGGGDPLPSPLGVLFENTMTQSILSQSTQEIVVEIPPGLDGEVRVSVWYGLFPVSNIRPFQVDAEPIVYRILAYGDSLVGPWTYHSHILDAMLNEHVGPSLVINEGKSGETISEGAQRLSGVLSTHNGVEYIYVLEGANDVSDNRNTPISEMITALDQMMTEVTAHSIHPILLTVPPRTGDALLHDQTWPTTQDWNSALRSYAIANGVDWVDLHQAIVMEPGWPSFLDESGLHLTPAGEDFVAETLYSALVPLL